MSNKYAIIVTRTARKDIDKLDGSIVKRIAPVIDLLADDPRPAGCLKVKSEEKLWRVRVGDYRIGYEADERNVKSRLSKSDIATSFTINKHDSIT